MKKIQKVLALLMALCTLVLCGCQTTPDSTEPTELTYSVSVLDGYGKAVTSGVIVQIMKGEEQVAMQPVNGEGKVEKTLATGEYTVQLQFTGDASGYYYDQENLVLTAEKTALEIRLYTAINNEGEAISYPQYNEETKKTEMVAGTAQHIKTGAYYVELEAGKRNYFLFTPEVAGTYKFSTADGEAVIGCYGYTSYILANSTLQMENGAMEMSITASMIGTSGAVNPYVIGVDAGEQTDGILIIERVGDPAYSIEENEPWIIYKPTVELKKFTTPEGTIQYFDLTASTDTYQIVFNENDQTYHLGTADGPQILVQLSNETDYLPAIGDICTTTGVKKYFYDENGEFVKREDYTECLQIYSYTGSAGDRGQSVGTEVYLDVATGLYPLTEDLKYIIQNYGDHAGWFDSSDPGFLFLDSLGNPVAGLNPDIAWLFLCCYVEA